MLFRHELTDCWCELYVCVQYLDAFRDMFETYKASAGYPEATLEII
jgi:hypothetical protein